MIILTTLDEGVGTHLATVARDEKRHIHLREVIGHVNGRPGFSKINKTHMRLNWFYHRIWIRSKLYKI